MKKLDPYAGAFPFGGAYNDGFSKLELMSILLMQSLLDKECDPALAARKAVWSAWELIAELNKDEVRCD